MSNIWTAKVIAVDQKHHVNLATRSWLTDVASLNLFEPVVWVFLYIEWWLKQSHSFQGLKGVPNLQTPKPTFRVPTLRLFNLGCRHRFLEPGCTYLWKPCWWAWRGTVQDQGLLQLGIPETCWGSIKRIVSIMLVALGRSSTSHGFFFWKKNPNLPLRVFVGRACLRCGRALCYSGQALRGSEAHTWSHRKLLAGGALVLEFVVISTCNKNQPNGLNF